MKRSKYSGEDLRKIRKLKGVGRPPKQEKENADTSTRLRDLGHAETQEA